MDLLGRSHDISVIHAFRSTRFPFPDKTSHQYLHIWWFIYVYLTFLFDYISIPMFEYLPLIIIVCGSFGIPIFCRLGSSTANTTYSWYVVCSCIDICIHSCSYVHILHITHAHVCIYKYIVYIVICVRVCKPASFHPGKNLLDWFRSSQNKSRQGESSRFAYPDQRSYVISVDMLSDKPLALASTLFELLTTLWLQAVTGQGLSRDTVFMSVLPSQERFSNRVRTVNLLRGQKCEWAQSHWLVSAVFTVFGVHWIGAGLPVQHGFCKPRNFEGTWCLWELAYSCSVWMATIGKSHKTARRHKTEADNL